MAPPSESPVRTPTILVHGGAGADPGDGRDELRAGVAAAARAGWLALADAAAGGGTVGAVAVDRHGAVAAATSTGGMIGKRPGRVGDSALIGCGTYADSRLGAV